MRKNINEIHNKKASPKKEKETNYVSLVTEQLKIQTIKGIHFDLKEYSAQAELRKNEVTVKIYFNGRLIKKTAANKKLAKQLCYKDIIDRKLI